jgi:AraC-like DNA-binding protein
MSKAGGAVLPTSLELSGKGLPVVAERRDAGLTVQRLSTLPLPAREQYQFWSDAVCDVFVGLDCRRDGEGPFFGTVLRRALEIAPGESASFIHVASEPQSAARSPRHIRRASDAWIMLVMQTLGPALLRQDGRSAALGPGDMVLFDSTRPYQFVFDRPFQQLVMKIPHQRLAARLPLPALWLGRPVTAASPLGKVLAAHVSAVSAALETIDPAVRSGLIERTIDLVAFTFTGVVNGDGASASTARRALAARAMQYIDARIDDPALSPARVADTLGISVGYLHRLFQAVEASVSGYIRERRLARCREELASALHAGERISEIALRWGFSDVAHFSRAFRQHYGLTPRDYRAAALTRRG